MAPQEFSMIMIYDDLEALLPFVDYRFCYNLDETSQVDAKDTQAIHVIVPKTIKK